LDLTWQEFTVLCLYNNIKYTEGILYTYYMMYIFYHTYYYYECGPCDLKKNYYLEFIGWYPNNINNLTQSNLDRQKNNVIIFPRRKK